MADETANEKAGRVLNTYDHQVGNYPKGETEPEPMVKPVSKLKKDRGERPLRLKQHNHETEPGQTEPWDMLHPGEAKP